MSSVKDIFSAQTPPIRKRIQCTRNPSHLSKILTKPSARNLNSNARTNSSQKPVSSKSLQEKIRLPHAHAPEGAEFHRKRFSYVQCRNQSSQTEHDSHLSRLDITTSNEVKKLSPKKSEEEGLEAQLETNLVINEEPGKTDRSSQCGNERNVKKKPFKGYRKITKPAVVIDPDCPPGHQALPEEERLQMLEQLQNSYESNLKELNQLPICVDTLRVRSKRVELENKLTQIEINVKIFSKPKVYVKIDK